jgi:hypothetical protein
MLLDGERVSCELFNLTVSDRKFAPLAFRHIERLDRFSGRARVRKDHAQRLGSHIAPDNRFLPWRNAGL